MAATKKYADIDFYQKKLAKVMERFGVSDYNWDFNRSGGWVEFHYKGQLYRFEHSVENAKAHGDPLVYGSDAFAQIVLALEDLARIVERGIYDLQNWIAGMKALPAQTYIPPCFLTLGLDHIPTADELKKAYRDRVNIVHPDKGGTDDAFRAVAAAYEEGKRYLESQSEGGPVK